MYNPTRGGTRGGQAEFKWKDVQSDKDREHYLGHSVLAPAGRWQKNKDIHWYAKDAEENDADASRRAEIKKIKEQEEDALAVALGFAPADRSAGGGSGANGIEVKKSDEQKEKEREDKIKRKAERHAEKQMKSEIKAQLKAERRVAKGKDPREPSSSHRHGDRDRRSDSPDTPPRKRSGKERERSRSPARRDERGDRERERSPPRSASVVGLEMAHEEGLDMTGGEQMHRSSRHRPYDPEEERARQRKRWDAEHNRREEPGRGSWGR